MAIKIYEEKSANSVVECGFVVNPEWPWLGASPDGVVQNDAGYIKIVEIKCPFSKKNMTITESCTDKAFCLNMNNNIPKLKENHPYYFQCQDLLLCIIFYHRLKFC